MANNLFEKRSKTEPQQLLLQVYLRQTRACAVTTRSTAHLQMLSAGQEFSPYTHHVWF